MLLIQRMQHVPGADSSPALKQALQVKLAEIHRGREFADARQPWLRALQEANRRLDLGIILQLLVPCDP